MARLNWVDTGFNTFEAKDGAYVYVVYSGGWRKTAELRIIRRENTGGMLVPFQDFSVYAKDLPAAKDIAKVINKAFRKVRKYNKLKPLQ